MKNIADQAEECNVIPTASTQNNAALVESAFDESIPNSGHEGQGDRASGTRSSIKSKCNIAAVEPHPCISKTSIVGRSLWAKYYAALNGTPVDLPPPKPQQPIITQPIRFSLAFAREHGVTDAILLYYLQVMTCDPRVHTLVRAGKQWIAGHSLNDFLRDLPCFDNRQTIYDGLQRLGERDDIDTDCTGELWEFPTGSYSFGGAPRWNKATDGVGWYAVNDITSLPKDIVTIEADDAREHGMLKACILSKFYKTTTDQDVWIKLSATELAKELPYSRVKIQNALAEMLESELIAKHEVKPKCYRRGEGKRDLVPDEPIKVESFGFFD